DHEDRAEHREPEEPGDDAFGALARPGVGVADPRDVRRVPRVGESLGRVAHDELVVAGVFVRAHEDFAPIQTAQAISRPMPTTNTHRPSPTGPMDPRSSPPGEPSF